MLQGSAEVELVCSNVLRVSSGVCVQVEPLEGAMLGWGGGRVEQKGSVRASEPLSDPSVDRARQLTQCAWPSSERTSLPSRGAHTCREGKEARNKQALSELITGRATGLRAAARGKRHHSPRCQLGMRAV